MNHVHPKIRARARLIDGKATAARVRADVARQVALLIDSHGVTPGLAVILVGENPASEVYVRNKGRQTREAGQLNPHFRGPSRWSRKPDSLAAWEG